MDACPPRKPYRCTECHARYKRKGDLRRHVKEKHQGKRFKCPFDLDSHGCTADTGKYWRNIAPDFERMYRLVNHVCKARHMIGWSMDSFRSTPCPVSRDAASLMAEDFNARSELPGSRPTFSARAHEPQGTQGPETRRWHGTLWKYRCYFPPELLCPVEGCEHSIAGKGCFESKRLLNHLTTGSYRTSHHGMSPGEAEKLVAAAVETAERKHKEEFDDESLICV
jgi:hypothetical protein